MIFQYPKGQRLNAPGLSIWYIAYDTHKCRWICGLLKCKLTTKLLRKRKKNLLKCMNKAKVQDFYRNRAHEQVREKLRCWLASVHFMKPMYIAYRQIVRHTVNECCYCGSNLTHCKQQPRQVLLQVSWTLFNHGRLCCPLCSTDTNINVRDSTVYSVISS